PKVAFEVAGRPIEAIPEDPILTADDLAPSLDSPVVDEGLEENQANESGDEEQAAEEIEGQQEAPEGLEPPRFLEYTIQAGDTVESIAQSELGGVRFAAAILRANDIEPHRLRPGNVILIPVDPENVQGKASEDNEEEQSGETPEGLRVTYIVREGDTLSQIASRFYGSSVKWQLIRDANSDIVVGTNIRPGMELVIPPMPAE
ncbi:MAG: LysM peptidoglycan-binding domain-containing protein, partial [Planctomycetota bacterium]